MEQDQKQDQKSDFELKIREIIENILGKETAAKIPDAAAAKAMLDKIANSISRQLTPEKLEKLKALGITLEHAVATLARTALKAVIVAGKAAERASEKL